MREKTKKETVVVGQAKITRGNIGSFNRARWNYMKKRHSLTDSKLVELKETTLPAKVNNVAATLIRFFDPGIATEKGVTIEDYQSLNEQPELILYEGYHINGRGGEIVIEKKDGVGTSILDEKIKTGTITDVGVVQEKNATQKWLGRFGTFMMMGGFLIVMFLIVGIVVAISLLSKSC